MQRSASGRQPLTAHCPSPAALAGCPAPPVPCPRPHNQPHAAQVQAVPSAGTSATAYTGVGQAARKIWAEEGAAAFWKGNGLNIIRCGGGAGRQPLARWQRWEPRDAHGAAEPPRRLPSPVLSPPPRTAHRTPPPPHPRSIFPYSAAQLSANDQYKRLLADEHGELSVPRRLLGGACAGMTATALTHPLDTMRLRLALPNHGYGGE